MIFTIFPEKLILMEKTIVEALKKTFVNRHHEYDESRFKQIQTFSNNILLQKRWKNFAHKINIPMVEFHLVLKTIEDFLLEAFMCVIHQKDFLYSWNAMRGSWK